MNMSTTLSLDVGRALCLALEVSAMREGVGLAIVSSDWTRWKSATFTGARHVVVIEATESGALDGWLSELPEGSLPLRGHLVADIIISSVRRADGKAIITLEALTVEE